SDIVASTPEELGAILAGVAGHSARRIAASDWIGQARRLDVAPAAARVRPRDVRVPELDSAPLLRVSRFTSARPRSSERAATPDEPTTVGLELTPDQDATRAPTLDYAAAIVARRLDGEGESPIAEVRGVVRVGQGVSLATAGPSLPRGLPLRSHQNLPNYGDFATHDGLAGHPQRLPLDGSSIGRLGLSEFLDAPPKPLATHVPAVLLDRR
ncbi:MAG: hypothetical protein M3Q31_16770, partial [Actinomycetota bacterium]|nr:hypothetical protein [Actinomycetota bacterium]